MVRQGSKPSAAVGICDFRGAQWDGDKKAERYAHALMCDFRVVMERKPNKLCDNSYSNREASVTDASVSSGAASQHFRLATRIATQ